jgi:hypothetical protein
MSKMNLKNDAELAAKGVTGSIPHGRLFFFSIFFFDLIHF